MLTFAHLGQSLVRKIGPNVAPSSPRTSSFPSLWPFLIRSIHFSLPCSGQYTLRLKLASSSDWYLDLHLILIQYLTNSTNLQILRLQCCLFSMIIYLANISSPGVTALQLRLQPSESVPSELNRTLTTLLMLFITGGRMEPILWPPITTVPWADPPQLSSIKVVPSPSTIVRESQRQLSLWRHGGMLNAMNCNSRTIPCSTSIVCVWSTKLG